MNHSFKLPSKNMDFSLICGSILFGIGWGLGGICPESAFILAPIYIIYIPLEFLLSFAFGYFVLKKIRECN